METWTIYGPEGHCEPCDSSHPHPLNNILEEKEIPGAGGA